ncbi:MAG TPA: protein kinase [Rubrivivax sp.]|nr:protein kinase [Rubrivivax sp.]
MPIKFGADESVKSTIDTYVVDKVLSQGAFAHAAKAKSTTKGVNVFLKRYFSPTPALGWYEGFVRHQQELKRRVTSNDGVRQYCYGFVDFFEGNEGRAKKTFHQVFEFIDNGKALTKFIEELAPLGPTAQWDQRVRFARVMMMGISALHGQRIVHTDLKPDNLLLIPNPHSPGEYHLKIIDLDWSIFSDQRAPWHGDSSHGGYVGTPMYMSPEHVAGQVPDERSDVFTCALMLAELLGGDHPFAKVSNYPDAIKRGSFERFRLGQAVPKVENTAYLEELVNRALAPEASGRPTAVELRDALFGRGKAGEASRPAPVPSPAVPAVTAPAPSRAPVPTHAPSSADGVELTFEGRPVLRMRIDTIVGRELLKPISADAQFASESQFRIHRSPSKDWMVSPVAGAQNETLVDGARLAAPTRLRPGMRLAIGNSAKGIEKLPLVVQLT